MKRVNLQFSVGEKEYINILKEHVGMTELQAVEHVINHKRQLANWHIQQGNKALGEQLLKEIGEL